MQYLIVIHIKPWSTQEPFKKQKPRGWGTGLSIHGLHVQVSKISVPSLKMVDSKICLNIFPRKSNSVFIIHIYVFTGESF